MEDETSEEDDEEMVCVPEDLEVAAPDDLHGGGDDDDEGQGDDDPCESGDGGEDQVCWSLLRILAQKTKRDKSDKERWVFTLSLLRFEVVGCQGGE